MARKKQYIVTTSVVLNVDRKIQATSKKEAENIARRLYINCDWNKHNNGLKNPYFTYRFHAKENNAKHRKLMKLLKKLWKEA